MRVSDDLRWYVQNAREEGLFHFSDDDAILHVENLLKFRDREKWEEGMEYIYEEHKSWVVQIFQTFRREERFRKQSRGM